MGLRIEVVHLVGQGGIDGAKFRGNFEIQIGPIDRQTLQVGRQKGHFKLLKVFCRVCISGSEGRKAKGNSAPWIHPKPDKAGIAPSLRARQLQLAGELSRP
jgi:hypothetical protein